MKTLEIYKEIKELCEKHHITYYAEGGTRVGATLIHEILPYDDDLDLRMPRQDFERFSEIAKKELPRYLRVLDCTRSPYSRGNMLKVHDTTTTFIECHKKNTPGEWTGIFVDIVPYDGAPEYWGDREALYHKGVRLYIYNILRKKNDVLPRYRQFRMTWWYRLFLENNLRPPSNRIQLALLMAWIKLHPVNYFSEKLDNLWKHYPDDGESTYLTCPERPWENFGRILYVERDNYAEALECDFYDTKIPVPSGHLDLSITSYGYPPRIDKESKHFNANAIVDLDRPVEQYISLVNFEHKKQSQ